MRESCRTYEDRFVVTIFLGFSISYLFPLMRLRYSDTKGTLVIILVDRVAVFEMDFMDTFIDVLACRTC